MDMSQLAVGVLAACAVGGVAYAVLYPYLSGEARGEQRQKALIGTSRATARAATKAVNNQTARREKITASLKEIEARQKEASKLSLDKRIAQAGLDWDAKRFYLISLIMGAVIGAAAFVLSGE